MCGRARLSSDVSEIRIAFGIPAERPSANFAPSWNVAPTDPLPVVRFDARDGQRSLNVMRWGLIPYWAKDIKIGFSTFSARAEEIDTKPEAFRQRRCLVPLDNFYEWQKTATGKQPYAIGLKGGGLMAMAGLWETWRSPGGERPLLVPHSGHSRESLRKDRAGWRVGVVAAAGRCHLRAQGGSSAESPLSSKRTFRFCGISRFG
jgi:putative SOS response-associated peptidase YedK